MKILILNTSDITGGASIAANRLLHALLKNGMEANMLVLHKQTTEPHVSSINTSFLRKSINKWRFLYERGILFLNNHFSRKNLFQVSIANTGTDISKHPLVEKADVIHLHWINQGFLSLSDIRKLIALGKPIVWTMHDMWSFTAICHYSWDCERYTEHCGKCPFLGSEKEKDLSYRTYLKKQFLSTSAIRFVAVSQWLKKQAERSALFPSSPALVIPNVIDITSFYPQDKVEVRKGLSFPPEKKIILMGAARLDNPIKGFSFLRDALKELACKDYFLVLFGGIKMDKEEFLNSIPIECAYMGLLSDPKEIARLYVAADVTVVPSYYETFGQTLIESMACGCPVVSFDNSGQTDIIDHKKNGYLARFQDSTDLADGIEWVIDHSVSENLFEACIKKVYDNYTESVIASQYINLYKTLSGK